MMRKIQNGKTHHSYYQGSLKAGQGFWVEVVK